MSMTFYAVGGALEIHVDNPGYGQISLYAPDFLPDREPLVGDTWRKDLHGDEIGVFLALLTGRALGTEPELPAARTIPDLAQWSVHLPTFLDQPVAVALLPAFQRAVVLAVAGTDRFERTFHDPDDPPRSPFCVRCNLGTIFSPGAMTNPWCEQYGHTPYGYAPDTSWAAASAHYDRKRRWWEHDQERARQDQALASGPEPGASELDDHQGTPGEEEQDGPR